MPTSPRWWRRVRAPVRPCTCRSSSCSFSASRRLPLTWTRSSSARRAAGEVRRTAARWTSRSRARGAWTGARWAAWPRAIQAKDSARTTSAETRTSESGPGASSGTRADASTGATATANKVHRRLRATQLTHPSSVYDGKTRALSNRSTCIAGLHHLTQIMHEHCSALFTPNMHEHRAVNIHCVWSLITLGFNRTAEATKLNICRSNDLFNARQFIKATRGGVEVNSGLIKFSLLNASLHFQCGSYMATSANILHYSCRYKYTCRFKWRI